MLGRMVNEPHFSPLRLSIQIALNQSSLAQIIVDLTNLPNLNNAYDCNNMS